MLHLPTEHIVTGSPTTHTKLWARVSAVFNNFALDRNLNINIVVKFVTLVKLNINYVGKSQKCLKKIQCYKNYG